MGRYEKTVSCFAHIINHWQIWTFFCFYQAKCYDTVTIGILSTWKPIFGTFLFCFSLFFNGLIMLLGWPLSSSINFMKSKSYVVVGWSVQRIGWMLSLVVNNNKNNLKVLKDEICRQYPIYKVLDVPWKWRFLSLRTDTNTLDHKTDAFCRVFRPKFENLTIGQPDMFGPFQYRTCLVLASMVTV